MSDVVSALLGVLVGGSITIAKDFVIYRTGRTRRGRFAAIRVICVLDEYVEKCVAVVGDDGTYYGSPAGRTSSGEEYHEPQTDCPEPPSFPDDIDWTSTNPSLMYRILALPNHAREIDRYIAGQAEHASLPDYDSLFEARWEGYADLGLEAIAIADDLRKDFKVPKRALPLVGGDSDARQFFETEKLAIERKRQANRNETVALLDALSDINA